jgi:uncharacterized protein YjbI with pentapeptide repeats
MDTAGWQEVTQWLRKIGVFEALLLSNARIAGELDLNGVQVLDVLAFDGVECTGAVRIRGCQFRHASFSGSEFQDTLRIGGVEFEGDVDFIECTIGGALFFGESLKSAGVTLFDGVNFGGTSFAGPAFFDFGGAGTASFNGTRWEGTAYFERVDQQGNLSLLGAQFQQDLQMRDASITGKLELRGARFAGLCALGGTKVGHLGMREAVLETAPEIGQVEVHGWAVLDQAIFERQVRLRINAEMLHCHRTTFSRGVTLSLAGELIADGSYFPPPSEIGGVVERPNRRPSITSMRRADVVGLSLSGVDVRACLFSGAHHLEASRLGSGLSFGRPPKRWHSPRDVVAEEQWRRRLNDPKSGWRDLSELAPGWFVKNEPPSGIPETLTLDPPLPMPASSIADLYRSLRRAREEGRDSPGSASFYFGEMEMRRLALRTSGLRGFPERSVLFLYWLISGYGLRAWRALIAFAVLLGASTFLLWKLGFDAGNSIGLHHSLRVAVASATSLVRPVDDEELNGAGFAIEILLRFVGPLLLALAALAVRAQVKR